MENVLTDPGVWPSTEEGLLREAKRILKPGGALYVFHFNTPHNFPLEMLREVAKRKRLRFEVLVHNSGERWRRASEEETKLLREHVVFPRSSSLDAFDDPGRRIDEGVFLAKLTKPKAAG